MPNITRGVGLFTAVTCYAEPDKTSKLQSLGNEDGRSTEPIPASRAEALPAIASQPPEVPVNSGRTHRGQPKGVRDVQKAINTAKARPLRNFTASSQAD